MVMMGGSKYRNVYKEAMDAYYGPLDKGDDMGLLDVAIRNLQEELTEDASPAEAIKTDTPAPPAWDDYVGQSRMKSRLQVMAAGARNRNEALPPLLFLAKPGSGKTTMAAMLAGSIGQPLHTLTKPPSAAQLTDWIIEHPKGVALFDEVHQWSPSAQHVLMQITESKTLDTMWGTESFPHLSIVAATTNPQRLDEALRSRFSAGGGIIQWDDYTQVEMSQIVAGMAERLKVPFAPKDCNTLAGAANGIPRNARRFVTAARDMDAAGLPIDARAVLLFCEVTEDGLDRNHLDYLGYLKKMKGQAGLELMENLLSMPKSEVRRVEQLLMERGFITLSPAGRRITQEGRKVINK